MKKIAISLGDPAGIGPEIVKKAINNLPEDTYVYITGSEESILYVLGNQPQKPNIEFFPIDYKPKRKIKTGELSSEAGTVSFLSVIEAYKLVETQKAQAIVTAPINKKAWSLAGFNYPGHTELLASLSSVKDYAMAFIHNSFRLVLLTIHTPILKVPSLINKTSVLDKINISSELLKKLKLKEPVYVLSLNPHAGENGLIGQEEKEIILAIKDANEKGIDARGPFVPDAFFKSFQDNPNGVILAMYHDQGLIPFKMISRGSGTNVTLGLPFVRTSPDHGTAFDIAGKNIASYSGMIQAIKTACSFLNL